MCAPKLRTPGIARSSMQAAVVIRTISGCDVPGLVTQCIRKSRSLKSGSSDCPAERVDHRSQATHHRADRGIPGAAAHDPRQQTPRSRACSQLARRETCPLERRVAQQDEASAGVTVSATTIEASTASA